MATLLPCPVLISGQAHCGISPYISHLFLSFDWTKQNLVTVRQLGLEFSEACCFATAAPLPFLNPLSERNVWNQTPRRQRRIRQRRSVMIPEPQLNGCPLVRVAIIGDNRISHDLVRDGAVEVGRRLIGAWFGQNHKPVWVWLFMTLPCVCKERKKSVKTRRETFECVQGLCSTRFVRRCFRTS